MISTIKRLFGLGEESDQQLWIMIQENDYFRSDEHLTIVNELEEILEASDLGELDGHSSGAHQMEINFFDVSNFIKAERAVVSYFATNHPKLKYTVSKEYETTYESS